MDSLLQSLSVFVASIFAPINEPVNIVFAGDAMQHAAQIEAAKKNDGTFDYSECFTSVGQYIKNADYAVVNLETPLGGRPYTGYPCFCAPDSYAEALRNAGFDLFLTANNHTLDRLDRGLKRTLMVLDSLRVDHIGTYVNDSCRRKMIPLVKEIKGYKIGFLNYTYGTNGIKPGRDVIVDYIDTLRISKDISDTRKAGAEVVVVAIHWGDEYRLLPNVEQKRLARFLQSQNVDIVIGGHPHVIQPMELKAIDSDSLKRRLLVYSLGNFISNMKTRDTRGGVMVRVALKRDLYGRPYIDKADYVPIFTVPACDGRNFRLVNALDSLDNNYEYHRRQFIESAKGVFDKNNIDVPMGVLKTGYNE